MSQPHPIIDLGIVQAAATRASALLKVLANPDRLLLMSRLSHGELSVGALEEQLGIRQPTLSQQLGVLRSNGLATTRREGKTIFYSAASKQALALIAVLHEQFLANAD
ncbi:ArsR family transcriptional regulator [Ralstonia sp. A12]|uniref:ArsR/SmtB family transcription factor n=1 Tax=Ralstonia sp. A12 TaxID=1217052 RepID=UPI000574588D|nr:metalloregulator ArsR/SmtB family transcription factor [Ralstonia sp. A12]KHK50956.1 ArsR family transcriptional regulator [Ralstonia sp. A12]